MNGHATATVLGIFFVLLVIYAFFRWGVNVLFPPYEGTK